MQRHEGNDALVFVGALPALRRTAILAPKDTRAWELFFAMLSSILSLENDLSLLGNNRRMELVRESEMRDFLRLALTYVENEEEHSCVTTLLSKDLHAFSPSRFLLEP